MGKSYELPYTDQSIDIVFSSLMFHHLNNLEKLQTLREVFRILQSDGEIHIADFGRPKGFLMYLISLIMRNLEETSDNYKGLISDMMQKAGFVDVEEYAQYSTIFGPVSIYKG